MKQQSLNTLIKLHEQKLMTMRTRMQVLEQQRQTFTAQLTKLVQEQEREADLSLHDLALQLDYNRFAEASRMKQHQLRQAILRLSGQIAELQELMRAEFSELKKIEKLMALQASRAKQTAQKKETTDLDEIAQNLTRPEADYS